MHMLVNLALGSEATEFTKSGGRGVTRQELEAGGWVGVGDSRFGVMERGGWQVNMISKEGVVTARS